MSRCLPFPPPNYLKNGLGGDALLKQLEHQRKKESKERRKERKERKRRRKLERNENEAGKERIDHDDKKHAEKFSTSNGKVKFLEENFTHANEKKKFNAAAEKFSTSPHANGKENFPAEKFHHANENLKASISTSERSMLKTEAKYTKLVVNWVPTPVQLDLTDSADEEWLYRKNGTGTKGTKTKQVSNDTGNGIYQGIQPHAHYLPDADIYALPYTLPF